MFTVRKSVFMALSLVSTLSQSAPGDKHFSRTDRNSSTVSIPSTCIMKAKAYANSFIMTPTDKATSMAFISVLSQPGSTFRIDYALTPSVTQGSANNRLLTTREMALSQIQAKPPQAVNGISAPSIALPAGPNTAGTGPSSNSSPTGPNDSNAGSPQGSSPIQVQPPQVVNGISAPSIVLPGGPNTASTGPSSNSSPTGPNDSNSGSPQGSSPNAGVSNTNDQPTIPPSSPASNQTPSDSQGMTEISLAGYMGSTLINLVGVEGRSQSQAQVYNSVGEAQTVGASASIAANLIQTSSNQATIGLDILAGNIKRFVTDLGIHSDLRSQLDVQLNGGSTLPASDLGTPTTLTHAIGLADIVTRIDIRATVMFDGTNLVVYTPVAAIGC